MIHPYDSFYLMIFKKNGILNLKIAVQTKINEKIDYLKFKINFMIC